jgi:hypothetical protein
MRTIGRSGLHDGGAGPSHAPECTELTVEGDRGFESRFLHQRVRCEPDYLDQAGDYFMPLI